MRRAERPATPAGTARDAGGLAGSRKGGPRRPGDETAAAGDGQAHEEPPVRPAPVGGAPGRVVR